MTWKESLKDGWSVFLAMTLISIPVMFLVWLIEYQTESKFLYLWSDWRWYASIYTLYLIPLPIVIVLIKFKL